MFNKEEIELMFPIGQNFHTGLWGFLRVNGGLNLNECVYKTHKSATIARTKYIKLYKQIVWARKNEYKELIN